MNITFLLGNGFDKALGLNTGYSDFYKWYLEQPVDEKKDHIVKFKKEIKDYVDKVPDSKGYWSDAEIALGQYTAEFEEDQVELFLECYDDFCENLRKYLLIEDTRLTSEIASNMIDCVAEQIGHYYQEVDPIDQDVFEKIHKDNRDSGNYVNFVCFNYTSSIDKVFDGLKGKPLLSWKSSDNTTRVLNVRRLVHAHGFLDKFPIVGVCKPENIANKAFLENPLFKITMLKSQALTFSGELWRSDVQIVIAQSRVICVYGMSLGETDSDYWDILMKWLKEENSRHLIVFWRNSKAKNLNVSVRGKFAEYRKVYHKLLSASELTADEFEKFTERIHIVLNSQKMFVLPENST